jgi:hypothetical protein
MLGYCNTSFLRFQTHREEFQSGLHLELLVVPFCQVDRSHAAAADEPNQPILADTPPLQIVGLGFVQRRYAGPAGQIGKIVTGRLRRTEQRRHLAPEIVVTVARLGDEPLTRLGGLLQCGCEYGLDLLPTFRRHGTVT